MKTPTSAPTVASAAERQAPVAHAGEPHHGHQQHQRRADRQRGGAPRVRQFERGRGDERFVLREADRRADHHREERDRRSDRDHVEKGAHAGRRHADQRRHPHMLAAPQGDHGAEHGEPQEQHGREFVGPDERRVQHIAARHAGQQHDDFREHQQGGGNLHQMAEGGVERTGEPMLPLVRIGDRDHRITPVFRRTSPAAPTPRRRTWLSSRDRSSSWPTRHGRLRGRRR